MSDLPERPERRGRERGRERGRQRGGRRSTLTVEAIVDAGMLIVDTEGVDALTMRAVAAALGTGAASLYAYVSSKEELLELLTERAIAEMSLGRGTPNPARWREQLKVAAREMRATYTRHGDLAKASFGRVPLGEQALDGAEWISAVLRAGGLSDRVVGLAGDLLALYVGAVAFEESIEARGDVPEQNDAWVADLENFFRSLPADRFPTLASLAASLTQGDGDARFEFGLDVIIAGLVAVDAAEPHQ